MTVLNQKPSNTPDQMHSHQPQTIQLLFDGIEVLRIEDGVKVLERLVPKRRQPKLMQLFWDGQEVYALKLQSNKQQEYEVTTNDFLDMLK